MQPIMRMNDYVEEYKKLTYSTYAKANNVLWTTYYQLSANETVYDENYMSTYRDDGSLSGKKFNKIHNMPVAFTQSATPVNLGSEEKGLNYKEINTSIVIDSISGLVPHIGDRLMFKISNDYETWEVVNINKSATLDNPYYQCEIKPVFIHSSFEEENVLPQEYIFVEYSKKIYPVQIGINYINCLKRLNSVIDILNNEDNYNHNLGYHIIEKTNCFPELETMLYGHDKVSPSIKILLVEPYDASVAQNSIFMLWMMPGSYDISKPLLSKFRKVTSDMTYNKKVNLWNYYYEFISSSFGSSAVSMFFNTRSSFSNRSGSCCMNRSIPDIDSLNNYLIDCLTNKSYNKLEDNSVLGKLANEMMEFMFTPFTEETKYPEEALATNLFEASVEYCQILKEILFLQNKGVELR